MDLEHSKIVDLTHPFNKDTIYWPTSPERFQLKTVHKGQTEEGNFYSAFSFCAPEHGGTHLDAPFHFSETGRTVEQIPVDQLVGRAVVIDVESKAQKDRDYRLKVSDVQKWEKKFGKIPEGALVLLKTGWSKRWPNAKNYLGDEKDVSKLHFPSFGEEAVQYLIKNAKIKAIGVDTASIDYGQTDDFPVHRLVGANNVPGLENLNNLDHLPEKGALIIALPMKISGGSGAPLRAIAIF